MSKWENDISLPDITILVLLSEILGITLNELLGKEEDKTIIVPENQRKDLTSMLIKICVDSNEGDKVRINLPLGIVKACVDGGVSMPQINGNDALKNIDFNEIFKLIEQGVVGKLVEIESADGDKVYITVE